MNRRLLGLVVGMGLGASSVQASEYTVDNAHSSIGFTVSHLAVSKARGNFGDFKATLVYDAEKPEMSKVQADIQVKSVNTNNVKRDDHLRAPDFFNVEKYPTLSFVSTAVKRTAPKKLQVDGTLTLAGVSRPVSLDVEEGGIVTDPWGNSRTGFSATTKISRKDFNFAPKYGPAMIGDEVVISIDLEATQPKAGAAPAAEKKEKKK